MPTTDDSNTVINMRVTANSIQGHRKYMEDCYKIRFQRESSLMNSQNQALLNAANSAGYFAKNKPADESDPQSDILFSYFGIFDGHGGKEASQFAKERLYWKIVEQEDFWSEDHSKVLNAIREGFIQCHMEMWNELSNWPKTASGLPSTSGSTATVLFIRKSKAYVGHVGDSGLLIGYSKSSNEFKNPTPWQARKLTRDHKPEDPVELKRIESMGGSVAIKSGVNRVVWNRPIINANKHRSTNQSNNLVGSNSAPYDLNHYKSRPGQIQTERIPFLAVARSLGDLWSYDINRDEFIVSPVPDVFHFDLDPSVHKCLILATDGLWNVMRANECVDLVRQTDKETEKLSTDTNRTEMADTTTPVQPFVNPSQRLVNTAMQRCCEKMIRADNTTCITIMLDQPPSYEDYLTNSNETIIKATNLTNLNINKTFDQTGKILNMSDDFDEEENELFKDELSEFDDSRVRSERKRKNSDKLFNRTTSTEIPDDEFQTPLSKGNRSRSLISIRRRRYSATSNRSTSVTSAHNSQRSSKSQCNSVRKSASKANRFVNIDNREQRLISANNVNNQINRQYMNKSASSNAVYQTRSQHRKNLFSNKSNMHLNTDMSDYYNASAAAWDEPQFYQTSKSLRGNKSITSNRQRNRTSALTLRLRENPTNYSHRKSGLNISSVSVGINKLSRNIRKSCNDLYSMKKKRQKSPTTGATDGCGKENNEKFNDDQEKSSKYSKRLRSLKNRLIRTKNNLFNRKQKQARVDGEVEGEVGQEQSDESSDIKDELSTHQSMPNLSKIELEDKPAFINDSDYEEDSYAEIDMENTENGQSFVNNIKARFNNLKRKGISRKSLQASDACMGEFDEMPANSTRKQNKRIKFF